MSAAAPAINPAALRGTEELPAPVSGQRHEIGSPVGRLTYYSAGPDVPGKFPPLLLVHSINAAGSAYEIKPLYEHYRKSRTVYALELPGFGHSDRGKREYTVRMMTDAILIAVREIQNDYGRGPIDALAVSLSSEFLARAATEAPLAFRSAALVSPTGFRSRDKNTKWREGTRGKPWLHALFECPLWSEGFFRLLTSRTGIRYFLNKTWGSRDIDEGLLEYDYLTTGQPGAQHAPYYFVSGFLFSEDIARIYHALTLPVWMSHGVRGDFVDYSNKTQVEGRPNWTIRVFQTGAMPHFEAEAEFIAAYDAFLAGAVERLIANTGSTIDREGIALYRKLVRNPEHVAAALRMMANWKLEPLLHDLPRLTTALVLMTAANDRSILPEVAGQVREILPSAVIERLPGLGHLAHEEQPELIARLIMKYAQADAAEQAAPCV